MCGGVTVCERWHKFPKFLADIMAEIGPRPRGMTLDRYPNKDGGYEPGNGRWTTWRNQRLNQTRMHNPSVGIMKLRGGMELRFTISATVEVAVVGIERIVGLSV